MGLLLPPLQCPKPALQRQLRPALQLQASMHCCKFGELQLETHTIWYPLSPQVFKEVHLELLLEGEAAAAAAAAGAALRLSSYDDDQ